MGGPIAVGGGIVGVIVLLLNFFLGGGDTSQIPIPQGQSTPMTQEEKAAEDTLAKFVRVVLAETEDVWNDYFSKLGADYQEPTLVFFSGGTQSGCGSASSATGPFYCPGDQKLYIDLSFYNELRDRFGAPGDFAMAYVVAHEVGHHIQTLMGTTQKMAEMRQRVNQEDYNRLSVMLELQADFLAGMWAHYTGNKKLLDPDDIEEALNAAEAIGDDRLQKEAQGYSVPESFTHGTSEQRKYWFTKGYQTGDLKQGDTFNDPSLR
jgi:predicted metalloprotease